MLMLCEIRIARVNALKKKKKKREKRAAVTDLNKYFLDKPQRQFWSRFGLRRPRKGYFDKENKMYEIKLKHVQCPHYGKTRPNGVPKQHLKVSQPPQEFPPFVDRDTSEGIPSRYDAGKSKPLKHPTKTKLKREEAVEKIEIYYFDHGNSA